MAYPNTTGRVLKFLGLSEQFTVTMSRGVVQVLPHNQKDQAPTESDIQAALGDATLVKGQTYSEWDAEHGGDTTKTINRAAKDVLDGDTAEMLAYRTLAEAILEVVNPALPEGDRKTIDEVTTVAKQKIDARVRDD